MTPQSAVNRHGRGSATALLANSALAIALMSGVSAPTALADDNMNPTPVTPVAVPPVAIVPNGVTGEAAKAAKAAQSAPAIPAAPANSAAPPDSAAPAIQAAPANSVPPASSAVPANSAAPVEPGTATEARPTTADEVLAIIYRDYDTGAGGGQLSTLIHRVMQMRSQGFMPSKSNKDAIVEALDYRPNQGPLVQALKETLATQQKQKAQKAALQGEGGGGPMTIGINQYDPEHPSAIGTFGITPKS